MRLPIDVRGLLAKQMMYWILPSCRRADVLDRLPVGAARAALGADLDQPVVLRRGVDHLPAFPDEVGQRLLDVDVLAGLAGPDRRQGVPVLHRGHGDRVEVLAVHQLADVDHFGRPVAVLRLDALGGLVQPLAVGIADGRRCARPAACRTRRCACRRGRPADHGQADLVVGSQHARVATIGKPRAAAAAAERRTN